VEAQNIFVGTVEDDIMRWYLRLQDKKDFIIPDILIYDYEADGNSVGNMTVPAIFEVKTTRVDRNKSLYKV